MPFLTQGTFTLTVQMIALATYSVVCNFAHILSFICYCSNDYAEPVFFIYFQSARCVFITLMCMYLLLSFFVFLAW